MTQVAQNASTKSQESLGANEFSGCSRVAGVRGNSGHIGVQQQCHLGSMPIKTSAGGNTPERRPRARMWSYQCDTCNKRKNIFEVIVAKKAFVVSTILSVHYLHLL